MAALLAYAKSFGLPVEIEGYSRGAYGAAFWAAKFPGVFREVRCMAGGYPDYPDVQDPILIYAGTDDEKWKDDSVAYAECLNVAVQWRGSSHNPSEFYACHLGTK